MMNKCVKYVLAQEMNEKCTNNTSQVHTHTTAKYLVDNYWDDQTQDVSIVLWR